jgi:murein DD-endopeptidase MepM/ murein hydrolase activator NlpD
MSKFPINGFSNKKLQEQFNDPQWGGVSRYNARRDGGKRLHEGVDLYTKLGEPVYAIEPGKVVWIDKFYKDTYGVSVEVLPGVEYIYGELQPSIPLTVGQRITEGQIIGYIGDTKTGMPPMLHFEYRIGGNKCDPMKVLAELLPRVSSIFKLFLKNDSRGIKASVIKDGKPVEVESFEFTCKFQE